MPSPKPRHDRATTSATWPRSALGRAALVAAAAAAAYVALALFALPVLGDVLGTDLLPELLDSWASPLVLLVLLGLTAVLGLLAWRRGEPTVLVRVVALLALALTALLAADVVLETAVGR